MPALPDPRLGDEARRTGQRAAGQAAEPLVEGDIDRIRECGDLRQWPAVEGLRLPQPRAVDMQRYCVLAAPIRDCDQFGPAGQLVAGAAQRQFDSDGAEMLCGTGQLGRAERCEIMAKPGQRQAVQPFDRIALVDRDMAFRMQRHDPAAAALGPDA